jgi:HlyD family secretion protein
LTQAPRVSAIEREQAEAKGREGELIGGKAEAAGRITEIDIEIASLTTQQQEKAEAELQDIVARELELTEGKHAIAKRIGRLDIRSPAAGLVLGLPLTMPQSVIRPADALVHVVPQDRPTLVAAHVRVTHVNEVRPDQDVRLVFSSLPSRTTPELHGHVTLVSGDVLTDERSGASYYRAEIAIDFAALQDLAGATVVPGMPVEAFIRSEDRTPFLFAETLQRLLPGRVSGDMGENAGTHAWTKGLRLSTTPLSPPQTLPFAGAQLGWLRYPR